MRCMLSPGAPGPSPRPSTPAPASCASSHRHCRWNAPRRGTGCRRSPASVPLAQASIRRCISGSRPSVSLTREIDAAVAMKREQQRRDGQAAVPGIEPQMNEIDVDRLEQPLEPVAVAGLDPSLTPPVSTGRTVMPCAPSARSSCICRLAAAMIGMSARCITVACRRASTPSSGARVAAAQRLDDDHVPRPADQRVRPGAVQRLRDQAPPIGGRLAQENRRIVGCDMRYSPPAAGERRGHNLWERHFCNKSGKSDKAIPEVASGRVQSESWYWGLNHAHRQAPRCPSRLCGAGRPLPAAGAACLGRARSCTYSNEQALICFGDQSGEESPNIIGMLSLFVTCRATWAASVCSAANPSRSSGARTYGIIAFGDYGQHFGCHGQGGPC